MTQSRVRGNVQHGEGGKFVDKYSDDDVVQALLEANPEPLTNKEVGQRVGCSKPTAHNRLHELADEGRVYTKKVGANARVWWVDTERPAREGPQALKDAVDELDRDELLQVTSRFEPDFNPTRTGTEDLQEFVLDQPYRYVRQAIEQLDDVDADAEA